MMNTRQDWLCPGLWLAGVVLLGSGCATTRPQAPKVDYNTLSDADFMHEYLAQQPLVTVDEACKAMLILADGEDTSRRFAEREAKLAERGILRPAWGLAADAYVDKSSLAYMVCKICRMTGGVNRILLGSWGLGDRRYALRELKFRRIVQGGADYSYVSGGELLGILNRADTYMENAGVYETEVVPLPEAKDPSTYKAGGGPASP